VAELDAPAVRLTDVRRRYGVVDALRGIDLRVERGTALAMFGSNGAGKTTLLRVIAGLLRPFSGRIELFGENRPRDPQLRRRIGVVGHESFLYPDLSALENLRFYSQLYAVTDDRRGPDLLSALGLEAVSSRPVRTFSRGMLQRLALARAILHDPELLLLDEPFAALDPVATAAVEEILRCLKIKGVTLLFSTHDIEGGLRLADRVIVMDRGRIAWDSLHTLPTSADVREIYTRFTIRC
jgi:heme exporter protein A